jgi:aminoglycoside phosphotransferase
MDLQACLPENLRAPATTITRIAAGLSGAGVYRVEAAGEAFVLKIADQDEPLARWRCKVGIQQSAAEVRLAPRVIHVDEAQRAVVSAFVVDRSFPALYGDPRTRAAALEQLGRAVRRVHEIPLPSEADPRDPLTQPNFGMPEGVSTDASRGELDIDTTEPQELPNPTVEEQESSAEYAENHGVTEGQ